jgi:hypothetical protein
MSRNGHAEEQVILALQHVEAGANVAAVFLLIW